MDLKAREESIQSQIDEKVHRHIRTLEDGRRMTRFCFSEQCGVKPLAIIYEVVVYFSNKELGVSAIVGEAK